MNETRRGNCVNCSKTTTFNARQAYNNLSRKYAQLADILATYMSQAGLERAVRTSNAHEMANLIERIVGGRPVPQGGYPECCLIGQKFPNQAINWFCTGVLVHPHVVLSAGHCHQPPGLLANIVALNCENKDQLGSAEIISARRTVVNPNYAATGFHDISVLILRKEATVAPVPIASTDEINAARRTVLVGFGNEDKNSTRGFGLKREVEVDITHIRRTPDENLDENEQKLGFESDLEFVAGGKGYDSCNGDSGGPAYILVEGVRKLLGLTSRGTQTATSPCGDGGIYTRVDKNLDFVHEVMSKARIKLS